jgi:hypothetical protein
MNVHWTATAFLFAGLVIGALSVWIACKVQRTLGLLTRPKEIRYWLAASPPGLVNGCPVCRSSIWTTIILSAPSVLIGLSIEATLIGIFLYLVFPVISSPKTDWGLDDNRNILISFSVITGICIVSLAVLHKMKEYENDNVTGDKKVKRELRRPNIGAKASSTPAYRQPPNDMEVTFIMDSLKTLSETWETTANKIGKNTAKYESALERSLTLLTLWITDNKSSSMCFSCSMRKRTIIAATGDPSHNKWQRTEDMTKQSSMCTIGTQGGVTNQDHTAEHAAIVTVLHLTRGDSSELHCVTNMYRLNFWMCIERGYVKLR